jgi:RND family efflux transporter MFP subunit
VRRLLKILVPVGIVSLGALGVAIMVALRPVPEARPPESVAPLVRTIRVAPETVQFIVAAQGTIMPRRQSDLVPQVSGEVVWVSPDLAAGGFFEQGDPLLRIDRADYEVALESARANEARAKSEHTRARKERSRQGRLADRSVTSEAHIDDAVNALRIAEASLREKRALLERAERDLTRTELPAPYAGRVREENVDVGQFASRGQVLAKLYAVDFAEVRLPLPDRELAYLDLSLGYRGDAGGAKEAEGAEDPKLPSDGEGGRPELAATGPAVSLHAEFAGRTHTWRGFIVRTEGEIDAKSRMVNVVARVEDPYGRDAAGERPPLAVGLFVQAEIAGRVVPEAFVVPRSALRHDSGDQKPRVLVVDDALRLRPREVEVLRQERERVVLGAGLAAGERVCVSPLRAVVDGMRVRVQEGPVDVAPSLAGAAP